MLESSRSLQLRHEPMQWQRSRQGRFEPDLSPLIRCCCRADPNPKQRLRHGRLCAVLLECV